MPMRFKTVDTKENGRTHFILECSEASTPIPFEDTIDVGSSYLVEQSLKRAFNGWNVQLEPKDSGICQRDSANRICLESQRQRKGRRSYSCFRAGRFCHARAIRWLTPQFPLGKYSTVPGTPGLGKSLLMTDLAARVSTGRPGPGSDEPSEPGDVIMIQNEDDAEDTGVPRLISAEADLSRVHFLTGIAAHDKSGIRPFTLQDVWAIEKLLDTLPNPKLATIDPVGSYCGKANAHYDFEVRGLLMPIADLGRERGIAIIGVTHFNKGSGKAIDRGMGSIAWVAAARVAWGVVKDTDDPTNRLFLPIKCNLSKDNAGWSFKIVDGDGAPRLAWSDTPETRTMDDILGAQPSKRAPRTDEAVKWLRNCSPTAILRKRRSGIKRLPPDTDTRVSRPPRRLLASGPTSRVLVRVLHGSGASHSRAKE